MKAKAIISPTDGLEYVTEMNGLDVYFSSTYGRVVMTKGKSKLKDRLTFKEAEDYCKTRRTA